MFIFSEIPRSEGGSRQKGVNQTIEGVGEQEHLTPQIQIEKSRHRRSITTYLLPRSIPAYLNWNSNGSSGVVEETGHRQI
jgi:hypothetical protein